MISNWLLQKTAGKDFLFWNTGILFSNIVVFPLQINNQLHIFFWFLGKCPPDFPLQDQTFFTLKAKAMVDSQISLKKGLECTCIILQFSDISSFPPKLYSPFTSVLVNFTCQPGYVSLLKYLVKHQYRCHCEGFWFCFEAGINMWTLWAKEITLQR